MAIKYVTHNAGGSGSGTDPVTDPWTFGQMLSATPAAGDDIRVCATGTYSRSATGTLAWANGTAAANILLRGANSSGVVDGTRPTIQASAGSITLLHVTGDHIRVRDFIFDGNSQTSLTGFHHAGTYGRSQRLKAMNCTLYGLRIENGNNKFGERLQATGCSGTAAIQVNGAMVAMIDAHANSCNGILLSSNARCFFFKSYANTGSAKGLVADSVGFQAVQGVVYGNASHGVELEGNVGFGTFLMNVVSYGNTGQDFYASAVRSGAILLNCAGRAGVANNNNGTGYHTTNLPNVENYGTLTGDPFTNAPGGIFLPDSTAGEGAILRAMGMNTWPDGGTSYFDIGLQHEDSGGGGSGVNRSILPAGVGATG